MAAAILAWALRHQGTGRAQFGLAFRADAQQAAAPFFRIRRNRDQPALDQRFEITAERRRVSASWSASARAVTPARARLAPCNTASRMS